MTVGDTPVSAPASWSGTPRASRRRRTSAAAPSVAARTSVPGDGCGTGRCDGDSNTNRHAAGMGAKGVAEYFAESEKNRVSKISFLETGAEHHKSIAAGVAVRTGERSHDERPTTTLPINAPIAYWRKLFGSPLVTGRRCAELQTDAPTGAPTMPSYVATRQGPSRVVQLRVHRPRPDVPRPRDACRRALDNEPAQGHPMDRSVAVGALGSSVAAQKVRQRVSPIARHRRRASVHVEERA